MTPTSDSSPSSAMDGGGVVFQNGVATGPIQMPDRAVKEFVDEFNATYVGKNMQLTYEKKLQRNDKP